MRFAIGCLLLFGLAMAVFAEEREPSRLGSILGYAYLSEDVSNSGTVMVLECGLEGIHLRVSLNEADAPKNVFNGVEKMDARTVLFAKAPNGEQAYFGFEGEGVTNGSGFFISEFIHKGTKTRQMSQYDDLSRFLTVYFSPDVTLGIASTTLSRSGSRQTELVNVTRGFNRNETLGEEQFARFRSLCQMAANGQLETLNPPACNAYSDRRNNFFAQALYDSDPLAGRHTFEYSGNLLVYGSGTKVEISGKTVGSRNGRLELRLSDALDITYNIPSVTEEDAALQALKAMTGQDQMTKAMQADPVSLRLLMPDGTLLSASDVTNRTVRLPRSTFADLKINPSIEVTGTGKAGTVTFSETISLAGFEQEFEEMMAKLRAHKETLSDAKACRKGGGDYHYIFDAAD